MSKLHVNQSVINRYKRNADGTLSLVENAEPTKADIQEAVKRFLKGMDQKDEKGNPRVTHDLLGIRQHFFLYSRDDRGTLKLFKRPFTTDAQGNVNISDTAEAILAGAAEKEFAANSFGAPEMPRPKWNKDGSPDFRHLEYRPKEGPKCPDVPEMPRPKWNRDGSPDYSHLNS